MATSVESYQLLMEHFPDAIVVHNGKLVLYMNREALRLAGATHADEVVGRTVLSFVAPRYVSQVTDRIAQVTRQGSVTPLAREIMLRLDGSEVHVEIKTMPITYGEIPAVQLVARECGDTEFRDLVAVMQVGVVVHGPGAEVLLSNAKALELLGLSEEQLLGKAPFDPSWRVVREDGSPFPGPEHPAAICLATGNPVRNTVMGVHRPTFQDLVWLSVDAVPRAGGQVRQAFVTFVDITERRVAKQKIQALLDEKNVILREVHHRIKNNMATVKGLLFLQAQSLEGTPAAAVLQDAESRVHSMMLLYDKLYLSENHHSMSVRAYLPGLVQEIAASFSRADTVELIVEAEDFVLGASALQHVSIIVNELLTNVMKYAFVGRDRGVVRVSATLASGIVTLAVADDGVGFPPGVELEHDAGFGLSLVTFLAKSLKATIRLERGQGTRIVLDFPLPTVGR